VQLVQPLVFRTGVAEGQDCSEEESRGVEGEIVPWREGDVLGIGEESVQRVEEGFVLGIARGFVPGIREGGALERCLCLQVR